MFRQDRTNPSTAVSTWKARKDLPRANPSTAVSAWMNGGLSGSAVLVAYGGIITQYTDSGTTYRVHAFRGSGSQKFCVLAGSGEIEYLLVGGGAGGVNTGTTDVAVGDYVITVGSGGWGKESSCATTNWLSLTVPQQGGITQAFSINGGGGGTGGSACNTTNQTAGGTGGSGGGGGTSFNYDGNGGAAQGGIYGTGFAGGNATLSDYAGGGGGGASAAGQQGGEDGAHHGGDGGAGLGSLMGISASTRTYAGGGGGSGNTSHGDGGTGGGGAGGDGVGAGDPNTGGGGGGQREGAETSNNGKYNNLAGKGGAGLVLIRYTVAA